MLDTTPFDARLIGVCNVKHYIDIDDLKSHPENSKLRNISSEQSLALRDSILQKGFYEPILVREGSYEVLSGNQRLNVAQELIAEGWIIGTKKRPNQIPVVIVDVDDKMAREILIGSNLHHGDWVEEMLAQALKEMDGPTNLGLTQEEIDKLIFVSSEDIDKEIAKASGELDEATEAPEPSLPKPKERPEGPEPFDSLTLPQSTMKDLKGILKQIAEFLNDDWTTKDSYDYATKVLCQAARESGFVDEIKKRLEK